MPTVRIEAEVDGLNEATQQVNNLNNALGAFPKMTRMELEALGKFTREVEDFAGGAYPGAPGCASQGKVESRILEGSN